jgi:hypothetical protein
MTSSAQMVTTGCLPPALSPKDTRDSAVSCIQSHRADRDNPEMLRTVQNFIENSGEIKNLLKFVAVPLNKLYMYYVVML